MDKWTSLQETKPMPSPKLLNMEPTYGYEGTIITLVLQELLPCQHVKLAFNSLVVETKQLQSQGTTSLVAHVPNFQTTLSTSSIVPISICYIEKEMIQDTIFIANFTYQSHDQFHQRGRKRSIVSFMNDVSMPNNKRLYQGIQQDAFSNYLPSNNTYNSMPLTSYSYYQQKDDTSSPLPSPSLPPPSYSQPFPTTSISTTTSPISSPSSTPSSPTMTQHTINKKPYHRPTVHSLKSTSHQPSTSVANYQPYPGLVSQNNLELITDLDTMMQNWTPEECQQGRRLVRFWRQDKKKNPNDDDDIIRCLCEPISQQHPNVTDASNIVVSCIYCPDRNDYFITSVDCIYLLESLMNTHFGVEEKNRIRRNLEGFRPITVAKCKPKSADFFKLVMGFPHPKPRNIEKDIKAFTWKILPYALKKIIMKYTVTSSASLSCNMNNTTTNNRSLLTPIKNTSSSSNRVHSKNDSLYHSYESSVPFTLPPCTLSTSSSATTNTSISSIISSHPSHPTFSSPSPMMNDDLHSISSSNDPSSNYYSYPNNHNQMNNSMNLPSSTTNTSSLSPQLSDASPPLTYVSSSSPPSNQLQFMDPIISTPTTTSFPIHSMPMATASHPSTPSSSMMLPPPNYMSQLTTDNISPYDSNILTYSS